MLSALKPISDLQRAQRFDDYDLTANRSGVLSTRQRWRFVGNRVASHALGALTALFIFALAINTLFLTLELSTVGLIVAIVVALALLSLALSLRPVCQKEVVSVKGPLRTDFGIPADSAPFEDIAIGKVRFYISPELFEVLEDEAVYQAYYLKRGRRVGGNLLLTVELLEHAPEEDE